MRDDKFMDGTIRVYESDKRHTNDYVLVNKSPSTYKFNSVKFERVRVLHPNSFMSILPEYDVVILHSFDCLKNIYISKIPKKCKVVWYAWGVDLYGGSYPIVPLNLYYDATRKYIESQRSSGDFKRKLYDLIEHFWLKSALKRIDYFSGVFPYEYDLIQKHHPFFKAKRVDFYYGDTDFFIKDYVNKDIVHGKVNIIIGNSADPRNNHLDALISISKIQLPQATKIIMPLSYAGSKEYVNWLSNLAEGLFPGKIHALQDYLPLQEYLSLISNCKVAIFYHERQQASDNIFMQMMYGARVYLSETCLTYKYLKEEGFEVFSLQSEADKILEEMPDEMILKNRRLLAEKYSEHTILERVTTINNQIDNDINNFS